MQESSNKTAGIIVGVIALALIAGGAFWFFTRDDNNSTTTNNETSQTQMADQAQPQQDIVAIASANQDFSTLVTALEAAGLVETLQGDGPFTVFAPTNAAFEKLPAGTVEDLLKPENKDQLTAVLTYHVVPAAAMSTDLMDGQKLKTVQGEELTVRITEGKVTLIDATGNTAAVTQADIKASNGVIHVIDTVVLPQ